MLVMKVLAEKVFEEHPGWANANSLITYYPNFHSQLCSTLDN